jgi:hypothetical protein
MLSDIRIEIFCNFYREAMTLSSLPASAKEDARVGLCGSVANYLPSVNSAGSARDRILNELERNIHADQ